MAFAALHRLLLPVTRLRDDLPAPQARALRIAFGEEDGPAVEPFLVAVATLSMLTPSAEESAVCALSRTRTGSTQPPRTHCCSAPAGSVRTGCSCCSPPETAPRPLSAPTASRAGAYRAPPDAARVLLDQRLDTSATEVTERLIVETGGNPLALLELPTELSRGPAPRRRAAAGPAAPVHRVEQAFLDRSRRLPAPVQSLLLLAAADDTGELTVVRGAASTLGLAEEPSRPPLPPGCSSPSGVGAVRHPLVRSAVYQAATGEQRRRVHRALADALARLGDTDREAWHRAAAAEGPDADVAAALELVGSRAERRGAYVSALAAYERAAALTTLTAQQPR